MNQKKKELEQNELAGALEAKLEQLKPHAFLISVVAVSIIAAIILIAYLIKTSSAIEGSRWEQLFIAEQSNDARLLEQVAKDNEKSPTGAIALIKAADIDAFGSLARTVQDKGERKAMLQSAKINYEKAYNSQTKLSPFLKRRALYGLAYACESLGEFEEARGHYQALVDTVEGTPIYQLAVQGLERTSDASNVTLFNEYLAWVPEGMAPGGPERPNIDFSLDDELAPANDPNEDGLTPPVKNDDDDPEENAGEENAGEEGSESSDDNSSQQ